MNSPDRSLLAVTFVLLGLAFFGVLTNVYPIAGFNTQSADEPIIPIWDPGGEDQTAGQTEGDDTPTPTLSSASAQSETSGATEPVIDPWASEVVEAALREPFAQGQTKKAGEAAKRDDLPRAASDNPAARPVDPVLSRVESPLLENTITPSKDPALTSTDQYPDVTVQPVPPQTSPSDSTVDAETFPQPSAPLDGMTSSPLSADSPPLAEEL